MRQARLAPALISTRVTGFPEGAYGGALPAWPLAAPRAAIAAGRFPLQHRVQALSPLRPAYHHVGPAASSL